MQKGRTIAVLGLAVWIPGATLLCSSHHDGNVSVSTETSGPIDDCGQIRVRFSGQAAARAQVEVAARGMREPLTIHAPDSSGVYVFGSDRRDVSIRACKAALDPEDLARIAVSLEPDGTLSLSGPPGRDWLVYLIAEVPRSMSVDLAASNGPLSVRGLSGDVVAHTVNGPVGLEELTGRVVARAQNGPISVRNCSGAVDAEADNGPISLRGGGGAQRLTTQNGPISVALSGTRWDGAGLEARAVNGPVSLRIPEGYRTGTRVESAGHSPFTCRIAACGQARKSWDEDSRAIEFGDSRMLVHLSTVNGPVSIKEPGTEE